MADQPTPLMPHATATWLVDNTGLSFEQIAEFCGLHALEIKAMADDMHPEKIVPLDPVMMGQLTREEALFTNQHLDEIPSLPRGAAWESPDVPDDAYADGRVANEAVKRLGEAGAVVGIFDLGMPDIEKGTVYMSLAEAQGLYDLAGQSTEIVISLEQLGQEPAVMQALRPSLSGAEITSWETNFPDLKNAISRKGAVMDVFAVVILGIAGIGILNLLMMAVYERTREIGLLGALGMRPLQITWLFLLEGAMMGIVGVAAGVALGLAVNGLMGQVGFDYGQFSSLTSYTALITGKVYSTLGLEKIGQRAITTLVIAILASIYPAREASQSEPAMALHHV